MSGVFTQSDSATFGDTGEGASVLFATLNISTWRFSYERENVCCKPSKYLNS